MGRQMLRYMVCDICETKKVESITDSKGNNSEYDTGIREWTLPVLVKGHIERVKERTIDVCEPCLKKVASVEWVKNDDESSYELRNEMQQDNEIPE